jgi:hypothetical protein
MSNQKKPRTPSEPLWPDLFRKSNRSGCKRHRYDKTRDERVNELYDNGNMGCVVTCVNCGKKNKAFLADRIPYSMKFYRR